MFLWYDSNGITLKLFSEINKQLLGFKLMDTFMECTVLDCHIIWPSKKVSSRSNLLNSILQWIVILNYELCVQCGDSLGRHNSLDITVSENSSAKPQ